MVQALALWTAVLIVVVSALADVVLAVLDPRVRASGATSRVAAGHNAVCSPSSSGACSSPRSSLLLSPLIVYVYVRRPHRLGSVFFHLDFGVVLLLSRLPVDPEAVGAQLDADVSLLVGGLAIAVPTGLAAAVFCASRPRTVATRTVETLGMLFYSMPAYLFGFGLLLLFEPSFGAFHCRSSSTRRTTRTRATTCGSSSRRCSCRASSWRRRSQPS